MVLIGHKDQHNDEVVNCIHLRSKIIDDHIIKVQHLGHMGIGIHIRIIFWHTMKVCSKNRGGMCYTSNLTSFLKHVGKMMNSNRDF
jgi:hypothetical protein